MIVAHNYDTIPREEEGVEEYDIIHMIIHGIHVQKKNAFSHTRCSIRLFINIVIVVQAQFRDLNEVKLYKRGT